MHWDVDWLACATALHRNAVKTLLINDILNRVPFFHLFFSEVQRQSLLFFSSFCIKNSKTPYYGCDWDVIADQKYENICNLIDGVFYWEYFDKRHCNIISQMQLNWIPSTFKFICE